MQHSQSDDLDQNSLMSLAKSPEKTLNLSISVLLLGTGVFIIVVFFLLPILWQILTSIKVNEDISAIPNVYLPSRFTAGHYSELFSRRPFLTYVFNSALVASISTVLCLVFGAPAAYVLTRMNLPGEKLILAPKLNFPGQDECSTDGKNPIRVKCYLGGRKVSIHQTLKYCHKSFTIVFGIASTIL